MRLDDGEGSEGDEKDLDAEKPVSAEGDAEEAVLEPEIVDPAEADVLKAAIVAARYSGPLPPPEMLRAYGEVVDGGAERIIDQWEFETKHRHAVEDRVVEGYVSGTTRAQWFAFIVITVIGVGGIILVALGKEIIGFAGFFLALASLVGSFFPGVRNARVGPPFPNDNVDESEGENPLAGGGPRE